MPPRSGARGPGRTAIMVISRTVAVGLPKVFRLPCPRRTATRALCPSTFIPITLMRPQAVRPATAPGTSNTFDSLPNSVSTGADTRPNQRSVRTYSTTAIESTDNAQTCCHTSLTTCTLPIGVFYLLTYRTLSDVTDVTGSMLLALPQCTISTVCELQLHDPYIWFHPRLADAQCRRSEVRTPVSILFVEAETDPIASSSPYDRTICKDAYERPRIARHPRG
jgi:hypothetical protein